MNRIKILEESVKRKIAAGEVIEGPFSVVKELLENAIDAGAKTVEVQVLDSGMKKILIKDNGQGIVKEDLPLAIMEHATSKIQDIHDIEVVETFGFRGEALSSIASVSDMTILTRHSSEEMGARLDAKEDDVTVNDFAGPEGTTIIVENLFYNIPARKKFLKKKPTELRYIRDIITRIALANHDIHFSLDVDNKRSITLPAVSGIGDRIEQIYNISAEENLYFDVLKDIKVTVSGFLSKPHYLKGSRNMQQLYINMRPVDHKYLGMHLSRAYDAMAMKGKYPAAFIFIEIDPQLVDVNIHPAKREVKLFDQRYIDSLILSLVKKVLNKAHGVPDTLFAGTRERISEMEDVSASSAPSSVIGEETVSPSYTETAVSANESRLPLEEISPSLVKEMSKVYRDTDLGLRILGIAFETYVIVEIENALHFMDIHAAHERIIYDAIMDRGQKYEVQELMFPKVVELSIDDLTIVRENIGEFTTSGFDLDEFSDNSIVIRAVPVIAGNVDPEEVLMECIQGLKDETGEKETIESKLAASIACHSAKRSGDHVPDEDLVHLIKMAVLEGKELRCPHGRPFLYKIQKNDLERMFKRQ